MPTLDFSGSSDPVTRTASGLDFSNQSEALDPGLASKQAAFRAQHGADVPLPSALNSPAAAAPSPASLGDVLLNQSIGVGNALGGSLVRTANVLPFIAGGLSNLLGDQAGAERNFGAFDYGKALADASERTANEASPAAAVAGNVLGIASKLAAPFTLAMDPGARLADLSSSDLQQGGSLGNALALGGTGAAASAAGLVAPVSVPGNLLVRMLTGGGINAAMGAGEQAAEHAIAPTVVAAPTAAGTLTQGGIGAILAAALGHGAPVATPEPRLEADPAFPALDAPTPPQGLPKGADFTARSEPVRPAPADLGGAVHVDTSGEAATPAQGASAFTQAVQDGMAPKAPGLPEPVVSVDRSGQAMTSADQNQLLAQQQAAIDQQQAAAQERTALGITPDIERTQGVRWAKQADATAAEADRQAQIQALDDAIAAREAQNKPARGINAKPDESVDDALTFLAKKGGLNRREFVQEGLDPAVARAPENLTRGGASRPLFRAQGSGGLSLDQAADVLHQYGYLPEADNNAALDLILHGVNQGEPAYSIHRNPQDDLLALQQARQDADHHTVDTYDDVPFSRKAAPLHPWSPVDASGSVPYAGGKSQDLSTTYIDKHVPQQVDVGGVPVDAHEAIALHEDVEGSLIHNTRRWSPKELDTLAKRMGLSGRSNIPVESRRRLVAGESLSYSQGHELATHAENHLVATKYGVDPQAYQRALAEGIAKARQHGEGASDIPTDLDTKPYANMGEKALAKPGFSFAGERARTADRGALQQAQAMEAMGRDSVPDRFGNQPGSPEDTHMATGWHRGVDGKWRFEIDDSQAKLKDAIALKDVDVYTEKRDFAQQAIQRALRDGAIGEAERLQAHVRDLRAAHQKELTVGDVLDHPALFDAYPELANVPVRVDPHLKGWGAYNGRELILRSPGDYHASGEYSLKSVMLHEIQHAIQNHEGFARGGSSAEARTLPEFEQALRQQMAERGGELPSWNEVKPTEPDQIKAAQQVYRRLAGEVEARNTQRRMNMDAGERRAVPPSETADVPRNQQIVRFGADRANREDVPHADSQAVERYNARLSDYIGAPVRFTPAAHVPEHTSRALAAFDATFGGRTVVVHNDTPDALDLNGVTLRDGVRLVNEDATSPVLTVAGHEMVHQLRKDEPDLYAELEDEVRRQGRLDAYGAVLNERARASGEGRDVHPDAVVEELTADAAGDALSDPEFIERLAQQNPSLFRRLADRLQAFFARVARSLRSLGSSPFLNDVESFRTKLADVLERYAQRQQGERGAAESPEHALSRKPADDVTDTPAFRRWFGDSHVVDAEGKPLRVYHGTNQPVDRFDHERLGASNNNSASRTGFFFTDHPQEASDYADAAAERVVGNAVAHDAKTADLTRRMKAAERRGDWDEQERLNQELEDHEFGAIYAEPEGANVVPAYLSMRNPLDVDVNGTFSVGAIEKAVAKAKAAGNDGVILRNIMDSPKGGLEPTTHFIVFKPEQIKSATGNAGTFDPENPSILFSRKPGKEELHPEDMPSRRPGESQAAYLRRITRKNGADIKAATALAKTHRVINRQLLRAKMAGEARALAIADAALAQARKTFDKTPDVINYASVHQFETGQPITDPDFRAFAATMQEGFNQRIAEIHRLAPDALRSLIEHYMPHLYEDSGKAVKWYQSVMGKRPLDGDKSFLKQRTWPTLKEAMASGLKPISPNPVDWVLMKYHQMDKFIGLLRYREELQKRGWIIKQEPGQRPPEGWARVDNPAFQIAGGLQGHYVVPAGMARDINTLLAPGLEQYGAWRSFRAAQNALVSANLGFSAFHASFTSTDNVVTHMGAGLNRLAYGDIAGGLKHILEAVPTVVMGPIHGAKLNRQWTGQQAADPSTAALLDLLEQGGARYKNAPDLVSYNNALPKVMRTLRRLQAPGALPDRVDDIKRMLAIDGPLKGSAKLAGGSLKAFGNAFSAIGEVGSYLIHHVLVPNQKMAARVTLLKMELDRYATKLGKQRGDYSGIVSVMNPDVARQLASEVNDRVDFRLGQMIYDNYFLPKIVRQVAQAVLLAPGWLAGSVQTATGGVRDIPRIFKPAKLVGPLDKAGTITDAHRGRFGNNLASLMALFLVVGGANLIGQYLMTGEGPRDLRDLVAMRTGRKNPDDTDERITSPNYLKDHYEFVTHPIATLGHKLNPSLRMLWDIAHNQDYFGNMIRDPHHSVAQQAEELAGYVLKGMLPLSVQNVKESRSKGDSVGQMAAGFAGFNPAPASINRSRFQEFVAKGGNKGWDYPASTPEEVAYQDRKRLAENALRTGQAADFTGLDPKDVANLEKKVQTPKPELQFARLALADKLDAYDLATPEERQRYQLARMLLSNDPRRSIGFRRLPEDEQRALLEQLERIREHSEVIGP